MAIKSILNRIGTKDPHPPLKPFKIDWKNFLPNQWDPDIKNEQMTGGQKDKEDTQYPDIDIQSAITYNNNNNADRVDSLQAYLGVEKTGVFDEATVKAIAKWQEDSGELTVDGKFGAKSLAYAQKHGYEEIKQVVPEEKGSENKSEEPEIDVESAIKFNKNNQADLCIYIQEYLGVEKTGTYDEATVKAIAKWQKNTGVLTVDGKFGTNSKNYAMEHGLEKIVPPKPAEVDENSSDGVSTTSKTITTKSKLRIYKDADENSKLVVELSKGTERTLKVLKSVDRWQKISYSNYEGWIKSGFMLGDYNLDTLVNDAAQKEPSLDVSKTADAAKYIARRGMSVGSRSQCTRGTSMFLQLASYARDSVNTKKQYKGACAACDFGSKYALTSYNICSSVANEYTCSKGSDCSGNSSFCKQIENAIHNDGEFVTFEYSTPDYKSYHIVFHADGGWYSDFKQNSASGVSADSNKFWNVHYFTK